MQLVPHQGSCLQSSQSAIASVLSLESAHKWGTGESDLDDLWSQPEPAGASLSPGNYHLSNNLDSRKALWSLSFSVYFEKYLNVFLSQVYKNIKLHIINEVWDYNTYCVYTSFFHWKFLKII